MTDPRPGPIAHAAYMSTLRSAVQGVSEALNATAGEPPAKTPDREHVELAREAAAAGLIVTALAPHPCGDDIEYAVQLWQADGTLWAEGRHESADKVREIIRQYAAHHPARAGVLRWDHQEQPDLDTLGRILTTLTDGMVQVHQVDTGTDEYAVILATAALDTETARSLYDRHDDTRAEIMDLT